MAKSNKNASDLCAEVTSVMRFLEGEEVIANLDWDETRFYVWLEPTWMFEDFCEECGDPGMMVMLEQLRQELKDIGVHSFCDLDGVNQFCAGYCGDDEPAHFWFDEWDNICGA